MRRILFAVMAVVTVSPAAFAADVFVQEPIAAYNWSGIYVGGQVGYAWGEAPFRNRTGDYLETTDYDPDGFLGGFYVGYNHQLSNKLVLGVDADINFANLKGGGNGYTRDALLDPWIDSSLDTSARMRWNGAVRARVGYAIDRFMPYVAGGVSFGELKFDLFNKDNGFRHFSENASMTGWNIGGGVEYAATDNLIVRAEYRYSDFGSKTFHGLWYEDEGKIKLQTHDIRLGAAYKF